MICLFDKNIKEIKDYSESTYLGYKTTRPTIETEP